MFTFGSIRQLFLQAGYQILTIKGVPAPFPLAIGNNWLSKWLLIINQLLIKISPRLFACQIFLIASPSPTLDDLLNKKQKITLELSLIEKKNSLLTDVVDADYLEILYREKFMVGKKNEKIYIK